MAHEEPYWSFTVVKGGTFSHTLSFEDDNGDPVNVSSKQPRMLVKWRDGGQLEWKRSDGYFTPVASDKFRFDLTLSQIEDLVFESANFFFFLNGNDELLFEGTIRVK